MPDRGLFWSPVPDWARADIQYQGLSVTARSADVMWLVSGNLPAFLQRRSGLPLQGPRDVCESESYALRLAPDRLLFVGRDATLADTEAFGWSDGGFAITDVSDGFVLFDIAGSAARDLMALGAAHDFDSAAAAPAESASMLFAGLKAAISRRRSGWRLHVERPYAAAMWHWLQQASQEWAKPPNPETGRPHSLVSVGMK
jgi:heterotetrameric sarcosine oxidase gamma subunit